MLRIPLFCASLLPQPYDGSLWDTLTSPLIMTISTFTLSILLFACLLRLRKLSRKARAAEEQLSQLQSLTLTLKTNCDRLQADYEELQASYENLQASHRTLSATNNDRAKHIAQFIHLCSAYIDEAEDYHRRIKKPLIQGNIKEALRLSETTDLLDKVTNELYVNFDRTFLYFFPDFVDSFNSLLQDDKRISPRKNELLSTELRIFALIRAGITDYTEIARFLRCSVNTIYNYRAKIKASLKVSKEEFEKFLMQ